MLAPDDSRSARYDDVTSRRVVGVARPNAKLHLILVTCPERDSATPQLPRATLLSRLVPCTHVYATNRAAL